MKRGSAEEARLVSFCSAKRGAVQQWLYTLVVLTVLLALFIVISIVFKGMFQKGLA